jgi:hypothetical protein
MLVITNTECPGIIYAKFPDKYPPTIEDTSFRDRFETFGIHNVRLPNDSWPEAQKYYDLFLTALRAHFPDRKMKNLGFKLEDVAAKV